MAGKKEMQNAAQILGRAGGLKGGPARARKLSKRKRREIARIGALAKAKAVKARLKADDAARRERI